MANTLRQVILETGARHVAAEFEQKEPSNDYTAGYLAGIRQGIFSMIYDLNDGDIEWHEFIQEIQRYM